MFLRPGKQKESARPHERTISNLGKDWAPDYIMTHSDSHRLYGLIHLVKTPFICFHQCYYQGKKPIAEYCRYKFIGT